MKKYELVFAWDCSPGQSQSAFYDAVMKALLDNVVWDKVKVVILASPGFVKDEFFSYFIAEAQRKDLKSVLENRGKILLCHSSTGHKYFPLIMFVESHSYFQA